MMCQKVFDDSSDLADNNKTEHWDILRYMVLAVTPDLQGAQQLGQRWHSPQDLEKTATFITATGLQIWCRTKTPPAEEGHQSDEV